MACGPIRDTTLVQAKGHRYTLDELLVDPHLVARHRHGSCVTLRLTAAMYTGSTPVRRPHRARPPGPGDAWNVNPPTLARVARVYCRNTRAVVPIEGETMATRVTLVPVGAVLVSSIHLSCTRGQPLRPGLNACNTEVRRGVELGHFEHGSTIVVLAPPGMVLDDHVSEGALLRVGRPLWRMGPRLR